MALNQLHEYLPKGWRVRPNQQGLTLVSPDSESAIDFAEGAKAHLSQTAANINGMLEISWEGCQQPLTILAKTTAAVATANNPAHQSGFTSKLSSYAPSKISTNASADEIADFIKGKKGEGLIVTITSMVSDKCLSVNDLQVFDRGGGWTGDDWIGLDFKKLWRDSFHIGKTNYYGQLIQKIDQDQAIPNFYYHIRRPSGALAEYSSSYHLVESFLGVPVRIAVSVPGDWQIIESAPDGSE